MSIKYLYENLILSSSTVITSESSINASYPLANYTYQDPNKKVKSTSDSLIIVIDLKTIEEVDSFVFLGGFDFESIKIEANGTDEWSSAAYTNNIAISNKEIKHGIIHREISTEAYRFWRITYQNTIGSSSCSCGKTFLGRKTELNDDDMNLGWTKSYKDLSKIQKNSHGNFFTDIKPKQRTLSGNYKLVSKENLAVMEEMYLLQGTYKPFFIIMDGEELISAEKEALSLYCRFTTLPVVKNPHFAIYDFSIKLEEVI